MTICALIRLVLLAGFVSVPVTVQAKWTEASSRHFVLLSEDEPEQLRQLAASLERFDQAVRYVSQLPFESAAQRRVTIYIVDQKTLDELVGPGSSGIYLGRAAGPMVLAVRGSKDATRTLFHEYVHHLQLSSRPMTWSFWYMEGAAELFATAAMRADGGVEIGLPLAERALELAQLQYRPLPPLLEMSDAGLRAQGALSYARSWLLVHYLMFEPARQGQLQRYLRSLEHAIPSDEAAYAAFGDQRALERSLQSYVKGPFKHLTVPSSTLTPNAISVRVLSAGEQLIIPYQLRFRVGIDEHRAHELLSSLRQAAASFQDDPDVQMMMARAEFAVGSYDAAQSAVDRTLDRTVSRVDAHLYKARVLIAVALRAGADDPARWSQLRQWFRKASELDPDDPQPRILWYLSFAANAERPTREAIAGLYRAGELAPQDHTLRLLLAYQYLADSNTAQAARFLALAASDPQTAAMASRVAAVLHKLEQSGAAAAYAAFDPQDIAEVRASLWNQ